MKIEYLEEILGLLMSEFGFKAGEVVSDGTYPMRINGRTDRVKIEDGSISFNNLKSKRAILTNEGNEL